MPELADPRYKSEGPPEITHCPECDAQECEDFVINAGYPRYLLDAVGMPDWGCDPDEHALCKRCYEERNPAL